MAKGYRCFFWDFDGTLYDSYPAITESCLMGSREWGLSLSQEEVLKELKVSVPHFKAVFGEKLSLSPEETEAAFRRFPLLDTDKVIPYMGVQEALERVCLRGGRNFLYTHRGQDALRYMERDKLMRYFSGGVTGEDGFPRKPAPDALLFLIGKYDLDRAECVMMGDRNIDLDAAKNAGIATCLFDPDGFYRDYAADHRLVSFDDGFDSLL